MDASASPGLFKDVVIILAAAGVVIPLFHRLRVSSVLGFMLVGALIGPFGLGRLSGMLPWLSPWVGAMSIDNPQTIEPIAGLGVATLMFMIGLDMSFERLWLMRRLVFGLGAAQLAGCTMLLAGAALAVGAGYATAVVLGLAAAMSSTAVVLQLLGETRQLGTQVGQASFAILLFQDLAVVPVLFTLGLAAPNSHETTWTGLGLALGQALVAVAALVVFGRIALRPLFRSVARTRSPELFMAACLLVVIAAALATASAGLSMPLGALIGGLLLAGTEYRREIEVTIDPFKGLLVGVFLISVGLGLNLALVAVHPLWLAATLVVVLAAKLVIIVALARGFGLSWNAGMQAGLILAPGGEFSFVILAISVPQGFLPPWLADQALIATALTMIATPLLAELGTRLAHRAGARRIVDPALLPPPFPGSLGPRVLIAGFGRVGQTVAAMLDAHRIPYVAIDRDIDRVVQHRAASRPVYYGDMTRIELLRRLDLATAPALVVTMDDHVAADDLVAAARAERHDLLIVARARDATHAAHLYRVGASDAVPETVEASLQLSEAVLIDLGVPMGPVIASVHEKRAEFQAQIRTMAPAAEVRPIGRRRIRDAGRKSLPPAG